LPQNQRLKDVLYQVGDGIIRPRFIIPPKEIFTIMNALAPTLSTRHLPSVKPLVRDILLVVTGSLLVAAFAQIAIPLLPFTPIPLTGQTFAVLLVGAALGSRRGAASLGLYTLEGALGLPFFAGAKSGLVGPTVGYLLGFIVAAYVIGLLAERGLDRSLRTSLLPFLVGTVVIYLFGATWLAVFLKMTPQDAFVKGVLPFLAGDAIKLALAGVALPAAWKFVK
jgi:biotin transport system substrate-specific component